MLIYNFYIKSYGSLILLVSFPHDDNPWAVTYLCVCDRLALSWWCWLNVLRLRFESSLLSLASESAVSPQLSLRGSSVLISFFWWSIFWVLPWTLHLTFSDWRIEYRWLWFDLGFIDYFTLLDRLASIVHRDDERFLETLLKLAEMNNSCLLWSAVWFRMASTSLSIPVTRYGSFHFGLSLGLTPFLVFWSNIQSSIWKFAQRTMRSTIVIALNAAASLLLVKLCCKVKHLLL